LIEWLEVGVAVLKSDTGSAVANALFGCHLRHEMRAEL
jgi:hypothetical protein